MAKSLFQKYYLFHPKTVQDILISPYSPSTIIGKNGTMLSHDGKRWTVIKDGVLAKSYFQTDSEAEAVDIYWRLECAE